MLLVGPSYMLGFYDSSKITMTGLCFLGLGCGMIVIPVLPDMIESVEDRYPNMNMDILHNSISGLFIAA